MQALKQASKQKVHVSKVQDPMALIHEIPIEIPTPSLHLKESGCKKLSLSESIWYGPYVNSFNLLWPKLFFFRICICITFIHRILGLFLMFFSFSFKKIKILKKKKVFVLYIFKLCNWGWPMKFTFHDCVPCLALMSFIFPYFASLCYIGLILFELFMVFNHMLLILNSHFFDCKN